MSPHPSEQLTVEGALSESAAELNEEKLSFLEEFLASLNLPEDALADLGDGALAIAASFLAALGFDDILPNSGAPDLPAGNPARAGLTNPSSIQQVSVKLGHCDAPAAAPVEGAEDLNTVLNGDGEVVVDKDGERWIEADCPSILAHITDLQAQIDVNQGLPVEDELRERLEFFLNAKAVLKCEGDYPLVDGDTREK